MFLPGSIQKRSGQAEAYDPGKIMAALGKAFIATGEDIDKEQLLALTRDAEALLNAALQEGQPFTVETVQDMAEQALMQAGHFAQAKAYILYRDVRRKKREERQKLLAYFPDFDELAPVLDGIERDFPQEEYALFVLNRKFQSLYKENSGLDERMDILIRAAIELTDKEAAKWEFIASRLYNCHYLFNLRLREEALGLTSFYDKLVYLDSQNLLAPQMLTTYTKEDLNTAATFMVPERDNLSPIRSSSCLPSAMSSRPAGTSPWRARRRCTCPSPSFWPSPKHPRNA